MSNEQTPVDTSDNLDTFSADLFGQSTPPEPAKPDEVDEKPPVEDAKEDTHPEDDDTLDTEDGAEEEVAEETPKPKKSRFQERIDELTSKQRDAERRALDLEAKLNEAIGKLNQEPKTPEPAPIADKGEPQPDAVNEDGTDKYPLGEFDPRFLKDYTKYHMALDMESEKQKEVQTAEQARLQKEQETRLATWNEKLEPARERNPDFQEKVEGLVSSLSGLEPTYGDYLSTQIMEMDHGTEVLYYLATHPDEARSIVDSGARKATLALGALEERLRPRIEGEKPVRKETKAPPPPPSTKGSAAAKVEVSGDTDDLDAFSRTLFKR